MVSPGGGQGGPDDFLCSPNIRCRLFLFSLLAEGIKRKQVEPLFKYAFAFKCYGDLSTKCVPGSVVAFCRCSYSFQTNTTNSNRENILTTCAFQRRVKILSPLPRRSLCVWFGGGEGGGGVVNCVTHSFWWEIGRGGHLVSRRIAWVLRQAPWRGVTYL